jgi:hypothetical protein
VVSAARSHQTMGIDYKTSVRTRASSRPETDCVCGVRAGRKPV